MTHQAQRISASKPARAADGGTFNACGGEEDISAFSAPSSLSASAPRHSRPREPPPFERAVVSRTRFHITLPSPQSPSGAGKAAAGGEADLRGWSSPNGEPYRPLGRPELNLKFSPQLVYGVSPMMQNAHRIRAIEASGGSVSAAGAAANAGSEKDKELREPSSCSSTGGAGTSLTALVDQFVTSLSSRKRPLDDRQVKLAHRLQANVGGFSPEKVRGLQRRKPPIQEHDQELTGGEHSYQSPRGDTSFQLLREAIDEGTSRLRSTRNGTSFLQKLHPADPHGLQELQEQYLLARTKTPQLMSRGNGHGTRTSPRVLLGAKTHVEVTPRHKGQFSRDEEVSQRCSEIEDGKAPWYLPYTTRQLQRSPHRRLPSLEEFRVRARDEKQPSRPYRASGNLKPSPVPSKLQVGTTRSNHTSSTPRRSSVGPAGGTLNNVEGFDSYTQEFNMTVPPGAGSKGSSPFAMTTACPSPAPSAPLHSIEKLQAAVDALEATKYQQSARLVTALEVLEQDRNECLAGKFRSLHVRCDAVEDLRRMRERSERYRGQRVLAVLSKTADWYPELLRRLLAREVASASGTGTTTANTGGIVMPLHAAELFIIQAVRRFANDGCDVQATQLFQVILHLHHDDLELLQVQQVLAFLRNALHINHEEWLDFFAVHNLPEPFDDMAEDLEQPRHG